eukprot:CAMPEP_0114621340 /NCGR_PEP_ID=MMETSP0168-20121206/9180_1 /TAXON_ID=95228 ORGANISM="Vannella sp., Strain DIVA3 517/6/12" /NCGR_SAMPLE_ID=MMETSP0168 /ASSEMBLY_ACC=CAM_ASM_000044 /LENGTH=650 /DNA_ID=CAMNT_0001832539 /DNA_START=128 /DNA_END=2077 /DNA_ORIENTATION=-
MRRAAAWAVLLLCIAAVAEATAEDSYRAAVVEHAPISVPGLVSREEAVGVMFDNLDVYEGHVEAAVADGAQIIVFNEDGLYGDDKCTRDEILPYLEYIPDPSKASGPIVLCDAEYEEAEWWAPEESSETISERESESESESSPSSLPPVSYRRLAELERRWLGAGSGNSSFVRQPVLRRVSCMAKTYSIVIVLDMGDLQPCAPGDTSCPSDGRYQYNTQVAFDETGALLGKYHKTHLYYEPQFNSGMPTVPVTFTTSFDVTFAMMICFDMMFAHPTLDYITSHDPPITDMVYSTWWVNTPPDFSATQIQQAYSRAMGLNVLASGNGLSWIYSGSGIYSEGRVLMQHYNPTYVSMDKLMVTTVPRIKRSNFTPVPLTASPVSDSVSAPAIPFSPFHSQGRSTDLRNAASRQPFANSELFSLRCPINSTYYIGEKERQQPLPVPAPPSARGQLTAARDQHWSYSYGNLTISTPFEATWGAENITSTAVAGNLTCTATLSVAADQPFLFGEEPEIYTVLAWEGWYDGTVDYYQERFCAVFRCYTAESCLSPLIYANTIVDSFRLEGNYAYGTTLYGLVASDVLLLVEDAEKINVGFEGGTEVNAGPTTAAAAAAAAAIEEENVGYVEAGAEFDTVLLNASLLGRLLYEDDSDS